MSLPRYAEYKNSRVAWLGEVPAHWNAVPLWALFRRIKRCGYESEQLLSVYRDHGVVPKASRDDNNNKPSDDLSPYQLVTVGDLAINKMKAWQGSVAVSDYQGIVSPAYFVYESLHHENPRYLHYLMRSPRYVAGYLTLSKGIRVNQWDLDPTYHSRMPILLPPADEQSVIAAFLDHETGKIDALIAEQEKLLTLLAEKRQAAISHAVTKGLDPTAPVKDSGVAWLGAVPAHWGTRTLAKASTKITNGYVGPTRDILFATGVPYIQATHIKRGGIQFGEDYFVQPEWSEAHSKSILREGDVLIVQTGAGTGDVGLVSEREEGFNCHALIIIAPDKGLIVGAYLSSVLSSAYGQAQLQSIQTGAMHPHLNCGDVKFVELPIPEIHEQHGIVEFVKKVAHKFDVLAQEIRVALALLSERRSALIAAAVTGKIDVREQLLTTEGRACESH